MSCPAAFASITTDPRPRYTLDAIQDRFWHTNTTLYINLNSAPATATPVEVNLYLVTIHPLTGARTSLLFRPNVTSLIFTSINWTRTQPVRYIIDPNINNKPDFAKSSYDITPTLIFRSGNGSCYQYAPPPVSITTRLNLLQAQAHSNYAIFPWMY